MTTTQLNRLGKSKPAPTIFKIRPRFFTIFIGRYHPCEDVQINANKMLLDAQDVMGIVVGMDMHQIAKNLEFLIST
jgi:hypothetical protein